MPHNVVIGELSRNFAENSISYLDELNALENDYKWLFLKEQFHFKTDKFHEHILNMKMIILPV